MNPIDPREIPSWDAADEKILGAEDSAGEAKKELDAQAEKLIGTVRAIRRLCAHLPKSSITTHNRVVLARGWLEELDMAERSGVLDPAWKPPPVADVVAGPVRERRVVSPEARRNMASAANRRWAKEKAASA